MKQTYCCTGCGHVFTYSRRNIDGRRCPDCGGHVTPCTVGIDLASEKDCTPQNSERTYTSDEVLELIENAKNPVEFTYAVSKAPYIRHAK